MMPFQIFCDYLEDRGVDTRLLRTQESTGFTINNSGSHYRERLIRHADGTGWGCGRYYGYHNGDGYTVYPDAQYDYIADYIGPGNGFSYGCGTSTGDGYQIDEEL